jgi:hypothetical protein
MTIYTRPDELVFAAGAKPGEVVPFPDILRGWGITFEQTEGKPPMEWMNAAFLRLNEAIRYLMQRGLPEWSSTEDYPVGAYVQRGGVAYKALQANTEVEPGTAAPVWTETVPAASTTTKGLIEIATATEAKALASALLAITPATLGSVLEERIPGQATEIALGLIKLSTTALAQAMVDDETALTPKKLAEALDVVSLGREQTWQDLTASRVMGVTYTNTTGKPILVWISANQPTGAGTAGINLAVNGHTVIGPMSYGANSKFSASILVPVGATYSAAVNVVVGGADGIKWSELRD